MYKKHLHHIKEAIFITVLWTLITLFYVFIKFNDIPEHLLLERYGLGFGISKKWIYQAISQIAFFLGILSGLLHTFVYPRLYRTKSTWIYLLFRTFLFSLLLLTSLWVVSIHPKLDHLSFSHIFTSDTAINIIVYMFLVEIIIGIFLTLRKNLGRNYFINAIINTYQNPKEEERVFMFLDLENSTLTAEKMGHLNFSRYIQDCFYYLSDLVLEHGGEVYQFVGDEAVITWKVTKKFRYEKCVALYFSYQDYLEKKKEYYIREYGMFPIFRSAVHCGKVSVALVGDYKKEIAYHGDILNFCSRLQKSCKENNAYILASEQFCVNLINSPYHKFPLDIEEIKGINNQNVYKINPLVQHHIES